MHFLITAGGTREYIDPVRFISNASSGKMGYALGRAAIGAGHKVTLISTPDNLRPPVGARVVYVQTSGEMFAAVKKYFGKCDCLIMAAAVCDYAPVREAKTKIKKTKSEFTLRLRPTVDILKWAGGEKVKEKQIVVGFALEDKDIRKSAAGKMAQKNLDMVIANTPAAIGARKASVEIKTVGQGWVKIENASKKTIAKRIIRLIEAIADKSATQPSP